MNHTTHFACKEIMERDGGKAVGCCCTGHKCKDMPHTQESWREGLRGLPQLYKASEGDIEAIEKFLETEILKAEGEVLDEVERWQKEMLIPVETCDCKTEPSHNCYVTSNDAIRDALSVIKNIRSQIQKEPKQLIK